VPCKVEPNGALQVSPQQSGRREHSGKRQSVGNDDHGRKQVTGGKHQQRAPAHDRKLRKQQGGRDQIRDYDRAGKSRNPSIQSRQGHVGEWDRDQECDNKGRDNGKCHSALSVRWWQGRQQGSFVGRAVLCQAQSLKNMNSRSRPYLTLRQKCITGRTE
jgi:hypothetical protein